MRWIVAFTLLLLSCQDPVITAEIVTAGVGDDPEGPPDAGELVDAGEPIVSEAELARTERSFDFDPDATPEPEVAEIVSVAALAPLPYRNPRYIAQCRRDNRRGDLPVSERVDVKADARVRARALARAGELDEVLIFSRMAYGEEGTPTRTNTDGYEAMLAVMDSLRGRMSRVEMMVNYAPRRVFPMPGDSRAATRQQWISELQLTGERPPSWPAHRGARWHTYPPWRSYGCPRWLATVDAVRALLRRYRNRRVESGPCVEQPDHWGGDMDDHDDDPNWRVIDCGVTEDTFWVVGNPLPEVEEEPEEPEVSPGDPVASAEETGPLAAL